MKNPPPYPAPSEQYGPSVLPPLYQPYTPLPTPPKGHYYTFMISESGYYMVHDGYSEDWNKTGSGKEILTGYSRTNTIAVVAQNDLMNFYINNKWVTAMKDATLSNGYIGMMIMSEKAYRTEVVFQDAKVWTTD